MAIGYGGTQELIRDLALPVADLAILYPQDGNRPGARLQTRERVLYQRQ